MNKYLMLSAAALLVSTAGANAAVYTFDFAWDGQWSCQGGILITQDKGIKRAAWTDTDNNCAGGTSEGAGILTKVKGLGEVYVMSDTQLGKNYGIFSEQISWTLPARPRNGAPWTLWVGLNGVSSFEGNSGTLVNVTKGKVHIPRSGRAGTASVVRRLLAASGRLAN